MAKFIEGIPTTLDISLAELLAQAAGRAGYCAVVKWDLDPWVQRHNGDPSSHGCGCRLADKCQAVPGRPTAAIIESTDLGEWQAFGYEVLTGDTQAPFNVRAKV